MRSLFTPKFWLDTFERSVFTFVEAFTGVATFEALLQGGFTGNLGFWAGSAGFATALTVLKSIGAAAKNDTDSASAASAIANQ